MLSRIPVNTLARHLLLGFSAAVLTALVLVVAVYAESRSMGLGSGKTGYGNTWTYVDGYGNTIADATASSSSSVYFQDVTGKSYSATGGVHKIDEHYGSIYNGTYVEMPGGNLISAWVTTRHYWRLSPYGGDYQMYTSHNGNFSTSSCYNGWSPCPPYLP